MNLIAVCLPFTEVPIAFIDRLHAPIELYLQQDCIPVGCVPPTR